jgi:hypothetical protein
MTRNTRKSRRNFAIAFTAAGIFFAACLVVWAQQNLTEPVYRVAAETSTATTSSAATATESTTTAAPATTEAPPANGAKSPFDLAQQSNEHPLAPVVRTLKASQDTLDKNIRDYSCTFIKRENVDGQLTEYQHIFMKVMHQPFSVYMSFVKPYTGREVVYVEGQNQGKLVALDTGVKRFLGKMQLDVQGAMAMKGNRHPITSVGIRNLCTKLIKMSEEEMKYSECDVKTNPDTKINGRSTTMILVTHPTPRQNFRFHASRIFLDNELRIPIHFDAYTWPAQAGAKPPLEESYTYQNLKINNNYTARDFDAYNNPEIFKQ